MKKLLLLSFLAISILSFGQQQTGTFSFSPANFGVNDEVTITVSGVDPTIWNAGEPNNIYLWTWYFDGCGNQIGGPLIGNGEWANSNDDLQLTNNGDGTYSFVMTPSAFYGTSNISEFGILVKADDGSGDKKTQDHLEYVGDGIVINISNPSGNSIIINSGDNVSISASVSKEGTTEAGAFEVFLNDVSVASGNGFPNYGTTLNNVTSSGTVRVEGSPFSSSDEGSCSFEIIIAPSVTSEAMPSGLKDGINYDDLDETKATLVLNAPLKDFVYVAGSFNSYNPGASHLMKKDPSTGKFWLELTGLTSGQVETYQYWVYALSPVADSPALVKTADPYSTLVLSPFDDHVIPSSTFPGLGTTYQYPSGQEREVTVLQTGQTSYSWNVTNFSKPKKEDLIIYEVLIRDFDSDRNFQDLIDRISYFKNLGINAIELMPVMEFENYIEGGVDNFSWGYDTSFHMALDKSYGTKDKFKEFIDLCHQNGIAVILDIAFNHATSRNPLVRMWMNDPSNTGWGGPSSENPFFNQTAKHAYSVFNDFNHSQTVTQDHVKHVTEYWINEFKIDGFRWDLTKGFTQNCTENDGSCTDSYQADRVAILKDYVDHTWFQDPDHYAIFEHLGSDSEEQEWANYRLGEGKGVMMWSEMWHSYKNLAQGKSSDINISRIGHTAHTGFTGKRTIGYPESHDKDRMMYEMIAFGEAGIQGNLNTSLKRMSSLGALFLTVPGPKMMWHFADLGMDDSIWTCTNGTVNSDYDGNNDGDCKLSMKPQPQWTENWLSDPNRSQVNSDWSRLIQLKINEDIFEGDYSITTNTQTPKIYIWDNALPGTQLKNVVILANFKTSADNVVPDFPYTGVWYDLMDETGSTSINVANTASPINIPAGEFRIYGNQLPSLSNNEVSLANDLTIYPNPTSSSFKLNKTCTQVSIFDVTGKEVKTFSGNFDRGNEFNISNLSQGIYVLKINDDSGAIATAKLLKQ